MAGPLVKRLAVAFTLSAAGLMTIQQHEGTVYRVYLDPVRIATVCTGHTATVTSKDVGKRYSPEVCAVLLHQDTAEAQRAVQRLVTIPITQVQYDALVSLTFNIGAGNLQQSTLLRYANSGRCWAAGKEFPRWVYARGKKLPGLVTRRQDERRMFESGCVSRAAWAQEYPRVGAVSPALVVSSQLRSI